MASCTVCTGPRVKGEVENSAPEEGMKTRAKGEKKKGSDKTNVCAQCGAAFRQYRCV